MKTEFIFLVFLTFNVFADDDNLQPNTNTPQENDENGEDKDNQIKQVQEGVRQTFVLDEENFQTDDLENFKVGECNHELVVSYRLFPFEETGELHENFICPYVQNDCCSPSSQKLIQILWGRISEPRLKRQLTRTLHHIEKIINYMKDLLGLFENAFLPLNEKYSAECLTSMDDMTVFVNTNLGEKLDKMYEAIKKKFNLQYKFKKQFYCNICNQRQHDFFNIFDKQIFVDEKFCPVFEVEFKDVAWFLNFEIVKYFETFRNYVLCYKEKNFLMIDDIYKFVFDREVLKNISDCRENQECLDFCQKFSLTKIPEIFIGRIDFLEEIHDFLRQHPVGTQGFIEKEGLDEEIQMDVDKATPSAQLNDFVGEGGEEQGQTELEDTVWDFYKSSFDIHKQRQVKKRMQKIKLKVQKDFDERSVHQNFLTINEAKIDLDFFNTKLQKKGINPYEFLDLENLYKVNANLTFYEQPLDNVVYDLMDLNQTNIMGKLVNVTKMIAEDNQSVKDVSKYVESKLFASQGESKYFLIENPYVNTDEDLTQIDGKSAIKKNGFSSIIIQITNVLFLLGILFQQILFTQLYFFYIYK